MQPGDLNEEIIIQSYTEIRSATGSTTYSWSTYATVWARAMEQTGREFFQSDQENPEARAVFRIHYRSDLDRKMRIVYRGDNWNIESIRELKHPNKMHLTELKTVADVE